MLLPRAASLGPLGRIFYSQWGPGPPGPLLFSVFCFSKRPPARHPEAARPPTDPEIKKRRPGEVTYTHRVYVFPRGRNVMRMHMGLLAYA